MEAGGRDTDGVVAFEEVDFESGVVGITWSGSKDLCRRGVEELLTCFLVEAGGRDTDRVVAPEEVVFESGVVGITSIGCKDVCIRGVE